MPTQVDLGKIRPVWKGDWAATTAYEQNDMVKEGVDSYICTVAHTSGSVFADTNWNIIAQGAEIPSQSGNAGYALKTDGTNLSWGVAGGVVGIGHYTDNSEYQSTPGAWNWVTMANLSPTYTMVDSGNDLIVQWFTNAVSSNNQGQIRFQYSTDSGSSWNLFSPTNATNTAAGDCHAQMIDNTGTYANRKQANTFRITPNAATVKLRIQLLVDSTGDMRWNRGSSSNTDIGGDGYSSVTVWEVVV